MNTTQLTAPGILTRAADILAAQGWTQQGVYEHTHGLAPADCPLDLGSALAKAAGIDIHSHAATDPTGIHAHAVMAMHRHLYCIETSAWWSLDALSDWQDVPGRTAEQVIAALRGAAAAASGAEGPFYPHPGSLVPGMPGYLVAECGHRVAASEWRAGLTDCERCPSDEDEDKGGEEQPALPDGIRPGQLYKGADGDLLFVIFPGDKIEFVTNRGTRVTLSEAERVYAPLTLVLAADDTAPTALEVAAAVYEALTTPEPARGVLDAHPARTDLLATRAFHVRRKAAEEYPVTYPTRDEQEQDGGAR